MPDGSRAPEPRYASQSPERSSLPGQPALQYPGGVPGPPGAGVHQFPDVRTFGNHTEKAAAPTKPETVSKERPDDLFVTEYGSVHTEPQFFGARDKFLGTVRVSRDQLNLHYVDQSGTVLTPQQANGLDRVTKSGLSMIDMNRASTGFASSDGSIVTPAAVSRMSAEERAGYTRKILNGVGYVAADGRIFSAEEVAKSHQGLSGAVKKISFPEWSKRGFVSETDGRIYDAGKAPDRLSGGHDLWAVDLDRIQKHYVMPTGQVIDKNEYLRHHPDLRKDYTAVDKSRIQVGFVSDKGVISSRPEPGTTETDLSRLTVGYLTKDKSIYTKEEVSAADIAACTRIDLDRYNPNRQTDIAKGASLRSCSTSSQPPSQRRSSSPPQAPAAAPTLSASSPTR